MLTGFTTTIVGGRTQISQGNPDLKPERSTSFDVGAEWTSRRDPARRHGVPDRRERPLHLERRRSAIPPPPGPDRAVGRRTGWTRTSAASSSRSISRAGPPRRRVREHHALLQPQGAPGERRGAGHPERPDAHDPRRRRRGSRTAERARVGPLRARPQGQRLQRAGLPDRRLRRLHRRRCGRDVSAGAPARGRRSRSTTCSTSSTTRRSAIRSRARRSRLSYRLGF